MRRINKLILIFGFLVLTSSNVLSLNIEEFKNEDINIVIPKGNIHESSTSIAVPEAYKVQTKTDILSGAKGVKIDKATGHTTFDYADFYSLNQLDAEQLKDANIRNRVLTFSHAGAVHIKDPILIDLDEIGPSTFWFEGNDLRAMEITFPKKKHYLINNPLTNDESSGLDIEHMIDSDKDGITDEVEKLRNLNPYFDGNLFLKSSTYSPIHFRIV